MSRPYIYMIPEEKDVSPTEVAIIKNKVVTALYTYLNDYQPDVSPQSKSQLLGPVGKLLSAVQSGRFENSEAIIGFVINIHTNTSKKPLGPKSLDGLKEAVETMRVLRKSVSERAWPRMLREIDYAVFLKQYGRFSYK